MSSIEDIFGDLDFDKLDLSSLGIPNKESYELTKQRILVNTLKEKVAISDKQTKYVHMNFFDVTSADDEKPYVGTTSLASCAGIAIYDPVNKIGGVAHVFFCEKETIQYGESIAIIDNPRPFDPFAYLAESLVRKADSIGGDRYKFIAFNIQYGCRTQEQNIQLQSVVERTVDKLKQAGKITDFEYRHDQQFKLDTRTGLIHPYY